MRLGDRVHWRRGAMILTGYVVQLTGDEWRPAWVRSNGMRYKPHKDDYVWEDRKCGL